MFPGLLCLLAVTGPPHPDGRDGLDHHEDLVSEDNWRGRQGVRQTEVRGSSRGTAASLKYRNMKNTSNNKKVLFNVVADLNWKRRSWSSTKVQTMLKKNIKRNLEKTFDKRKILYHSTFLICWLFFSSKYCSTQQQKCLFLGQQEQQQQQQEQQRLPDEIIPVSSATSFDRTLTMYIRTVKLLLIFQKLYCYRSCWTTIEWI